MNGEAMLRGEMHAEAGDLEIPAIWAIAHVAQDTPALPDAASCGAHAAAAAFACAALRLMANGTHRTPYARCIRAIAGAFAIFSSVAATTAAGY